MKKLLLFKNQGFKTMLLLGFLFLFSNNSLGQTSQTFLSTSSSSPTTYTWVCPQGVTSVSVQAWGGGGGGGFARTTQFSSGGGGGGGAFAGHTSIAVTPGATYTISVGNRGANGTSTGTAAGVGGITSFIKAATSTAALETLLSAPGGGAGAGVATATATGGIGGTGGQSSACTGPSGYTKWSGGNGATGTFSSGSYSGGGAGSAGTGANGNNGTITTTPAAAVTGGVAGTAAVSSGSGGDGLSGGGGGTGGKKTTAGTDRSGGSGGSGKLVLTYTCPSTSLVLPLIEGFNFLYGNNPSCWTQQTDTNSYALTFVNTSPNTTTPAATRPIEGTTSTNGFVFWSSSTFVVGSTTRLVSPKYTTSSVASGQISFSWQNENNPTYSAGAYLNEGMTVQYSLDGTTWIDIQFIARHDGTMAAGTNAWVAKTVDLPAGALGQSSVFFGFKFVSQLGSNCAMDNLKILPACTAPADQPTSLTFTNPGTNQITVNYVAPATAPSGYLILVYPAGSTKNDPTNGVTYVSGSSYDTIGLVFTASNTNFTPTLTGLSPNTSYDFYVYDHNNTNCVGPIYNTTNPLTGTQSTAPCLNNFASTITVDPSATAVSGSIYNTLTSLMLEINGCGVSGPTVIELANGYNGTGETFPITLRGAPGMSSTNTITIRPAVGASIILTAAAAGSSIITIGAGTNWIIDGRAGGTGTSQNLTIENTSLSTSTAAIRLMNGAQYNTIKYCNLKSASTSTSSYGTVTFSSTTLVTPPSSFPAYTSGNSYNTISNCNISDASTGSTANMIVSNATGTSSADAILNSYNTIDNNNIFNFYNATSTTYLGSGIFLNSYNSNWIITNNSFYQTSTRTSAAAAAELIGIQINSPSGGGFTITGNYIGGTAPNCAGTPMTFTTSATNTFRGIYMNTSALASSTISNNTIKNISFSSTTTSSISAGISFLNGSGTISGNTIGDLTVNASISPSIIFSSSGSSVANFNGILAGTGSTYQGLITISNNSIGGILCSNSGSGSIAMSVIRVENGGLASTYDASQFNITGNTIGSTSTSNSLYNTSNNNIHGIYNLSVNTALTNLISNNTISNFNSFTDGLGTANQVLGIRTSSTSNTCTINNNTIYNLSSDLSTPFANSGGTLCSIGIYSTATAGGLFSGNTIHSLSGTNATVAQAVAGIYIMGQNTGTASIIEKNNIHSMFLATSSTSGSLFGIYENAYPVIVKNNIIRLGTKNDGSSITAGYRISGVYDAVTAGATSNYFNSVYIGGSSVVGSASNTYALQSAGSTNARDYRNNILFNARSNASISTGKNYAYSIVGLTNLTSDNNDYFANGTDGVLGYFGSDKTSLSGWQTTTSTDANSISSDPNFTSTTNLLPTTGENLIGTSISDITTDYTNSNRVGIPSMGAYEVSIPNCWTGDTDTVYNTSTNWEDGTVPASGNNIVIPSSVTNSPVLDANKSIGNIFIGTNKTIDINGKTLTLNGAVSGTGTIKSSATSNLTIGGASGTLNFTNGSRTLKDLTLNSSATATLGTALDITAGATSGTVTVGTSATLTTGGNLTLKSDANGTAKVGNSAGAITGNVTVERYIPAKRAWRALTAPLKGSNSSIFSQWQNNGTVSTGVGVELWHPSGDATPSSSNTGLAVGPNSSILQYVSGAWSAITNTNTSYLFTTNGNNAFMLFPTGGYGSGNITGTTSAVASTLKATGQLITGQVPYTNLPNTSHTLIGNPYASPLDPAAILTSNASLGGNIWVWDANTLGSNNVGCYNLFNNGAYTNLTGSLAAGVQIQSGQAFFVKPTADLASFTIEESHKGSSFSNAVLRTSAPELFRVGLYKQVNNEWSGRDGAMTVILQDANANQAPNKMANGTENIAFTKNGANFASNHHLPLVATDVLNVKVWNTTPGATYKLKLNTEEFATTNLSATLEDLFTNSRTPLALDGSAVEYPFSVTTDALSSGDRFRIVFQTSTLGTTIPTATGFSIVPNPVTGDSFQVNLGSLATGTYSYSICNALGQEVEKGSINTTTQNTNYTVKFRETAATGIYIMKIKGSDNSVFTAKLIKK